MSVEVMKKTRHILSLSGGKDSTALAIFMRDKVEDMEYVFCDTGEELPETYEYLDKLEVFLGKQINRLNPDRPFSHYLQLYRGVLPDPRTRWCTRQLKIYPFEKFVGNDSCISYVGIRFDEAHRKGYISTKPNISTRFPFIESGITKDDVFRILDESGIGLPEYYKWRSRSGCYFCFFQQKIEWVGLLENHPDLFKQAQSFERKDDSKNEIFTWNSNESLKQLSNPERILQIKNEKENEAKKQQGFIKNQSLLRTFDGDETGDESCLICHL